MARPWYVPQALKKGDVVRIVAPSGAFERPRFEAGVAVLQSRGLRPVFNEELFGRHLYFAGTDARRQAELESALLDPTARAIWCARGGYGAVRVLPQLGVEELRRNPKWLIGFSDPTALHCVWAQAGLVSVHGANVHNLASWSVEAREALFAGMMEGAGQRYVGKAVPGSSSGGAHRGRVLGGNLTVLASLAGTGFLPSWRGAIVFLEDVGERPYRLDRCITQLRLAGAFAGAVAVAVGQLTDCAPSPQAAADTDALQAIFTALAPLNLPIISDLPIGHEASSQPLLLGAMATLDADAGTLVLEKSSEAAG